MGLSLVLVAVGRTTKDLDRRHGAGVVPELRADSRYNRDVDTVTSNFAIGLDMIQVIAEAKGDNSPCLSVQDKIEKFEFTMRQVEVLLCAAWLANMITQQFAEDWYKWRMETVEQIAPGHQLLDPPRQRVHRQLGV